MAGVLHMHDVFGLNLDRGKALGGLDTLGVMRACIRSSNRQSMRMW